MNRINDILLQLSNLTAVEVDDIGEAEDIASGVDDLLTALNVAISESAISRRMG